MKKKELLQLVKNGLAEDTLHPVMDVFKCKGHVYDFYPEYGEAEGYFFRDWIFEAECSDGILSILVHDIGNQHMAYTCLANRKAMDRYIAKCRLRGVMRKVRQRLSPLSHPRSFYWQIKRILFHWNLEVRAVELAKLKCDMGLKWSDKDRAAWEAFTSRKGEV